MYIFFLNPRISHLSKDFWFILSEMVLETKIWVLHVLIATGMSFASTSSQLTEQENIYMPSKLYVCVCVCVSVYFCM